MTLEENHCAPQQQERADREGDQYHEAEGDSAIGNAAGERVPEIHNGVGHWQEWMNGVVELIGDLHRECPAGTT